MWAKDVFWVGGRYQKTEHTYLLQSHRHDNANNIDRRNMEEEAEDAKTRRQNDPLKPLDEGVGVVMREGKRGKGVVEHSDSTRSCQTLTNPFVGRQHTRDKKNPKRQGREKARQR